MIKYFILGIICLCTCYNLHAQNEYSLSIHFDSYDKNSNRACYILKLKNESLLPWSLASQNYTLLYNTANMSLVGGLANSFLPLSSYTPLTIISNIENIDSTNVGSLPMENNFGVLNFTMDYKSSSLAPIEIEPDSSLVIAKLCFNFTNNVVDDNICTSIVLADNLITWPYWKTLNEVFTTTDAINFNVGKELSDKNTHILPIEILDIKPKFPDNCPILNNGEISISANNAEYYYFIDETQKFSINNILKDLTYGTYPITLGSNLTGCTVDTLVTLDRLNCEICNDGIDNDLDGLIDCGDDDCMKPEIDYIIFQHPSQFSCPDLNDGYIYLETNHTDQWSIDNGNSYHSNPNFTNLTGGVYVIRLLNSTTGCIKDTTVTLLIPSCEEICFDLIDNDGDGYIDCADYKCGQPQINSITLQSPTLAGCTGSYDGSIVIDALNATAYTIRGSFQNTGIFTSLKGGYYDILLINELTGCVIDTVIYLPSPCVEICNDSIDNDNDGLLDCMDDDCLKPSINEIFVKNPTQLSCPKPNDGYIFINALNANQFSINGGNTYQTGIIFNDLMGGTYDIALLNSTTGCKTDTIAILVAPDCSEICFDQLDNNGDGYIDCDDNKCRKPQINNITIQNTTSTGCLGTYDGSIIIDALNTTLYIIKGNVQNSGIFTGLKGGYYDIQLINESTGCSLDTVIFVPSPCVEICNDGIDNDSDGLLDCQDDDCLSPLISEIIYSNPTQLSCPDLNDGEIFINTTNTTQFSVNGGTTFQNAPIFNNLTARSYDILLKNATTGCISDTTITLVAPSCAELCNDGIDNDGNGLIDCDDALCDQPQINNITIQSPTMAGCLGAYDGSILFDASKTSAFFVNGNVYQSGQLSGLMGGYYYITLINESTGCTRDTVIYLPSPCTEICNDGIDNDNDGLIDCADNDCLAPDIQEILFQNPTQTSCPDLNDGNIQINASNANQFSIDGGAKYQSDPNFNGLMGGVYNVLLLNSNSGCKTDTTITLLAPGCLEICDDNIDNDGDGYMDCLDTKCGQPQISNITLISPTLVGCIGALDGSIMISATNTSVFILNGISSNVGLFSGLKGGYYDFTLINESTGCTQDTVIYLPSPCVEICNDGIDNDNDGLIDCTDNDCPNPGISGIVFQNPTQTSCPLLNDGNIQINAWNANQFSIDGGTNYQKEPNFNDLIGGVYDVLLLNSNSGCKTDTTITLIAPECLEICDDDVDNDGDGLIDCLDNDCEAPQINTIAFINPTQASCPDLNDGSIEITSVNATNYSIDNGKTYQRQNQFMELFASTYLIRLLNDTTGCTKDTSITLLAPVCKEICDDDKDNDGDSLIDCVDLDCVCTNNDFIYPNIISLNGDGANSKFFFYKNDHKIEMVLEWKIYNRWGNLVYSNETLMSHNKSEEWDLMNYGKKVEQGVYVVQIKYKKMGKSEADTVAFTITCI